MRLTRGLGGPQKPKLRYAFGTNKFLLVVSFLIVVIGFLGFLVAEMADALKHSRRFSYVFVRPIVDTDYATAIIPVDHDEYFDDLRACEAVTVIGSAPCALSWVSEKKLGESKERTVAVNAAWLIPYRAGIDFAWYHAKDFFRFHATKGDPDVIPPGNVTDLPHFTEEVVTFRHPSRYKILNHPSTTMIDALWILTDKLNAEARQAVAEGRPRPCFRVGLVGADYNYDLNTGGATHFYKSRGTLDYLRVGAKNLKEEFARIQERTAIHGITMCTHQCSNKTLLPFTLC